MALDDADMAKITEHFAALLKKHGEDAAKTFDAQIAKAVKGVDVDKKMEAKLEALKAELAAAKADAEEEKPAAKQEAGESPELKRLRAEMADLARKAEAQARRAEELEASRKSEALTNGVRDALLASGADPKRVSVALSHLRATQAVKLDEKGNPVFVVTREWGEDPMPAAKGAAEWLQTEEGKFFLPPTGAQGTGDRAGSPERAGGVAADPMQIALAALSSVI